MFCILLFLTLLLDIIREKIDMCPPALLSTFTRNRTNFLWI